MASDAERDIVIIGGGIIGCTSAYFLTRHPAYNPTKHRVTIIEASKIAGGASGKAGGLLGLWAYPSCLVPLSFKLHEQLAREHGGESRWDYRRIACGSLEANGRLLNSTGASQNREAVSLHKKDGLSSDKRVAPAGLPKDLNWISKDCSPGYSAMGSPTNTAQVHPYLFTTSMAQLAEEKGAKTVLGLVSQVHSENGRVKSVEFTDKDTSESKSIPASDVIVAAGPWTQSIYPEAGIEALRAHSVTIRPSQPISGYALFTEIDLPAGFGQSGKSIGSRKSRNTAVTPEIYARPNNEAYACGAGDTLVPLPKTTADVETDDARCQDIIDYVSSISDELRDGEVTVRQACYLPLGGPLIGPTGVKGLLLASGHTCWGIQNGPGTGKLISEMVFDGKAKSADVSSLDPRTN